MVAAGALKAVAGVLAAAGGMSGLLIISSARLCFWGTHCSLQTCHGAQKASQEKTCAACKTMLNNSSSTPVAGRTLHSLPGNEGQQLADLRSLASGTKLMPCSRTCWQLQKWS